MRALLATIALASTVLGCSPAAPQSTTIKGAPEHATTVSVQQVMATPVAIPPAAGNRYFNDYILKAVDVIEQNYARRGYDIHSVFTHDLSLGGQIAIPARGHQPMTMCVAAQMEIMVEALNLYIDERPELADARRQEVLQYLPNVAWTSLHPMQLRGQIWVVEELRDLAIGAPDINSHGAADALAHLGMGETIDFAHLAPGAFINLNRNINQKGHYTGHGVVFINYIDVHGEDLPAYDAAHVAGFRYYSAQGSSTNGGFGYKRGFFAIDPVTSACPPETSDLPRAQIDCGIRRAANQIATGQMLNPQYWSHTQRDAWFARMEALRQERTRGDVLDHDGTFDGAYYNGDTGG
ncbi:MAG: hypothetical protein QM759_09015 [Terricaulis sp.]